VYCRSIWRHRASGVSDETTSIFLESAYFESSQRAQNGAPTFLNTDASFRFERGIDPNGVVSRPYTERLFVLEELAGATLGSELVDLYEHRNSQPPRRFETRVYGSPHWRGSIVH
jgi:phenylalanyl-tRNA synthetase beta chain